MEARNNIPKVAIQTSSSLELVAPDKIIHCQIKERAVELKVYPDRVILATMSLKQMEEVLSSLPFFRCHAKSLVNLDYVQAYSHKAGEVTMEDGATILVAKDRRAAFYKILRSP